MEKTRYNSVDHNFEAIELKTFVDVPDLSLIIRKQKPMATLCFFVKLGKKTR